MINIKLHNSVVINLTQILGVSGDNAHRRNTLMTSPSRILRSPLGQKFTSDSNLTLDQQVSSVTTTLLSSPYHSDVAPTESREYHVLDQILSDLTPAPVTTASPSKFSPSHTNVVLEQVVIESRRNSSHYSATNSRTKQVILVL